MSNTNWSRRKFLGTAAAGTAAAGIPALGVMSREVGQSGDRRLAAG
ncbi:twin-arginine translocation signal domain-containing protein [Amycolatopsis sp. cmx-4-61]